MYTNAFDILAVDALLSFMPAITIIALIAVAKGLQWDGVAHGLFELLWFVLAVTCGAIYGKVFGAYLPTVIVSGLVYLAMRINPIRKWLFSSWTHGLITAGVVLGYYALIALF